MPDYSHSTTLPFSADQIYALVFDVAAYPQFLPWCLGARLRKKDANNFDADLIVGFKGLREKFTSRVYGSKDLEDKTGLMIESKLVQGSFSHLLNRWQFQDEPQGCKIDFYVSFKFKSAFLSALLEPIFLQAQRKMIAAFEKRAFALYQPIV